MSEDKWLIEYKRLIYEADIRTEYFIAMVDNSEGDLDYFRVNKNMSPKQVFDMLVKSYLSGGIKIFNYQVQGSGALSEKTS